MRCIAIRPWSCSVAGSPVAFTSRALTVPEKNYAQVEKELLSIVHACERFDQYLFGREVTVETDHKPLEAIIKKPLLTAPKRLKRMIMRLQNYQMKVVYKNGRRPKEAVEESNMSPGSCAKIQRS